MIYVHILQTQASHCCGYVKVAQSAAPCCLISAALCGTCEADWCRADFMLEGTLSVSHAEVQQAESSNAASPPPRHMHRRWIVMKGACRDLDNWLKTTLQANLNALVALALIVTLIVGTLALTGFLTVRIGPPYCIPCMPAFPFW